MTSSVEPSLLIPPPSQSPALLAVDQLPNAPIRVGRPVDVFPVDEERDEALDPSDPPLVAVVVQGDLLAGKHPGVAAGDVDAGTEGGLEEK